LSYRKNHIKRKIKRTKPKKSILKRRWFWVLILSIAVVLTFLFFLLFFPGLQLNNIIISGNHKVQSEELRQFISKRIGAKLIDAGFFSISTKSIFITDMGRLSETILREFPIVERVSAVRELPDSMLINIEERAPIGAYCPDGAGSDFHCFLIDENGIFFEQLNKEAGDLVIVRQTFGENSVSLGENILQKNIAEAIYKIQSNLKNNFQIDLKEALITSPLRLDATTSEDWKIYFNLGQTPDIDSQLTKLDLLLKNEISSEARKHLEYIDLRFSDRAFYK